jgi:two-component system sensor histidine kinase VanS
MSVRLKLALSYAGFLVLAGVLLLAAAWVSLFEHFPGIVFITHGRVALIRDFAPTAALALAFLLVFGLAGGWLLAGRMLAPLSRITHATRLAAKGALSHRIELEGPNDEFRELADAFDAMLARLEARIAEQRRFAANASHELRTPLAITQALLDVARSDPDRDSGALDERLRAVNARAINLTEALLLLSRTDQGSFSQEPADLSLIAEEATETLLPLAEKHGVTIETSGEIAPAVGSRALLLQMVTNLVHNAIVHNFPDHGAVRVTTSAGPAGALLTVENTGEPLAPQLAATLTEPFQRGTERTHGDHAGVGLGLAIVKSIAQAHGGTLALTPRAAGGLCVTVQLPAARLGDREVEVGVRVRLVRQGVMPPFARVRTETAGRHDRAKAAAVGRLGRGDARRLVVRDGIHQVMAAAHGSKVAGGQVIERQVDRAAAAVTRLSGHVALFDDLGPVDVRVVPRLRPAVLRLP